MPNYELQGEGIVYEFSEEEDDWIELGKSILALSSQDSKQENDVTKLFIFIFQNNVYKHLSQGLVELSAGFVLDEEQDGSIAWLDRGRNKYINFVFVDKNNFEKVWSQIQLRLKAQYSRLAVEKARKASLGEKTPASSESSKFAEIKPVTNTKQDKIHNKRSSPLRNKIIGTLPATDVPEFLNVKLRKTGTSLILEQGTETRAVGTNFNPTYYDKKIQSLEEKNSQLQELLNQTIKDLEQANANNAVIRKQLNQENWDKELLQQQVNELRKQISLLVMKQSK